MLYEVSRVQQVAGEPRRRWFFSHEQDLLIWFGADGRPVAFQLSYGKYRDEHAIRWKADQGFAHYSVDDGESSAHASDAPILLADGIFPASRVLERFLDLSREMPADIARFVAARLREHPDYGGTGGRFRRRGSGIASGLALGVAIAAAGLLLWRLTSRAERHNTETGADTA
jgi:hypothetical protein